MIGDLKPYSAMKDSGTQWLGEVPAAWEVRKLRGILRRVTVRNRPDLPLLSVVRERGVIRRDMTAEDDNHNFVPDDLSNYKVVRPGQFAMNKMKAWQGSYGVSQYEGIVSPAYFVFDLAEVEGRFFHTAIRSRAYVPSFAQASDGVRIGQWDLAEPRMREISLAIPPLSEQAAIVRFLEHADRRIRRYIRTKQKLIKLLEEQKQAIIRRAVTRGLDPNVRLKHSGVDWLGDAPEHWEVVGLRYLATKFGSGVTPRGGAQVYQAEGVPFLRSQNVHFGGLRIDAVARVSRVLHEQMAATHVRPSDVLLNVTGASIGRACAVPENFVEGNVNQHVCIIRPRRSRIDPRYLAAFLSTPEIQTQIYLSQNGSSREGLTLRDIRALPVLVPPLEEQRAIIHWAGGATAGIDEAITRAGHETDLLREYRTRLIADVVTGKLDVREAAARLPQEAEDLEPLDEAEVEGDAEEGDAGDTDGVSEEAEA